MRTLDWSRLSADERADALRRPEAGGGALQEQVAAILEAVRGRGDAAVREFSREFDGVEPEALAVGPPEMDRADAACDPGLLEAVESAMERIEVFHAAGLPRPVRVETAPGLVCEAHYLPISPVGLYVPGGSAPLISTVLMLAIPARLAGCGEIVLCTPPGRDGRVHPPVLAAARRCGVNRVFKAGGAQAIAAMAYGTESIPKCAKLFGPGNAWVTEAKRQAASDPEGAAQDLPAGPSEVLVIADGAADPEAVCWDLLSQAEHGPDSQAILLSDDDGLLRAVRERIPSMAAGLPRVAILERSLPAMRLVRVADLQQAVRISNRYAPEHLIVNCEDPDPLVNAVTAAGSVFVGPWTPESLGDYCSGTNHVLPTYGYARAYSGLSVRDFMRRMTLQRAAPAGLLAAGPDAARLAAAEGLDAHRMAVEYRIGALAER